MASFPFPLAVNHGGRFAANGGDEAIRGKIIQVLFTAQGERVNLPDFGCGLFNLVFEPNDSVLAAAMEFTVGQALSRWLDNEILVEAVNVETEDENSLIEIVYSKRVDLSRQMVRIQFK